ncbi:hypothetical protein DFJ77DRAFT_59452 [Powellomyces hirtus]|nr:hypothetical protein DFJ77DRAFT_59452 [Powellomyces hirtus]
MIIKVFYKQACRRFMIDDPDARSFDLISAKIRTLFNIPPKTPLDLRCRDFEGDWVTVASGDELAVVLENDLASPDDVLKIYVGGQEVKSSGKKSGSAGGEEGLRQEDEDREMEKLLQGRGEEGVEGITKREVIDMLRDISLYISHTDPATVTQWVSAERNLITPDTKQIPRGSVARQHGANAVAVAGWTVDAVCDWLRNVGFPEVESSFAEHDITGEILLALTSGVLKEMGMLSTGKRIRLLQCIADLREDARLSPPAAPSALT